MPQVATVLNVAKTVWQDLQSRAFYLLRDLACSYCHAPIDEGALLCPECLGHTLALRETSPLLDLPGVTRYAASSGSPAVQALLYDWKFHHNASAKRVTADLLLSYWWQLTTTLVQQQQLNPTLVPIWLTAVPPRRGQRSIIIPGYHPPSALEQIGQRMAQLEQNMPLVWLPRLLGWRPDAHLQQNKLLRRQDRFTNVKDALIPPTDEALLALIQRTGSPQALIILDDLTTTGATLQSAIHAAQQATQSILKPDFPVIGLAALHVPFSAPADIDNPS